MNSKSQVWDLPTRIIHWMIAIPVLLNFFVEGGKQWHKFFGYVALAGLILRLIWGFTTKGESRFSAFPFSWRELKHHTLSVFQKKATPYPGHNPMAAWTYVFIWLLVGLLGVSGFMMGLDAYWGEEWLEEIHDKLASGMQIFLLLHFLGIGFDSFKFKRKTWLRMLTGGKN